MTKVCDYCERPAPADEVGNFHCCGFTNHVHADVREELVEALRKISDTALSFPFAGVTCGEIARAALAKAAA